MLETVKEDENILQQVLELSNVLQRHHQVGYISMFGIAMKSCPPPKWNPATLLIGTTKILVWYRQCPIGNQSTSMLKECNNHVTSTCDMHLQSYMYNHVMWRVSRLLALQIALRDSDGREWGGGGLKVGKLRMYRYEGRINGVFTTIRVLCWIRKLWQKVHTTWCSETRRNINQLDCS